MTNLIKIGFYLSVILSTVLLGIGFENFATELITRDNVTLNDASYTYIEELIGSVKVAELRNLDDRDTEDIEKDSLFGEDSEGGILDGGLITTFNYVKGMLTNTVRTLKFIYHVPTFGIRMLGFDLGWFGEILRVLTVVLNVSLIVLIVRELK